MGNPALGEDNVSYWVVNDNEVNGFNTIILDGETDGRIPPMQAFFIKSETAQPTIHFDTNMTVDKDVTKGVDIAGEEQNSRIRLQVGKGTASSSYLILNADASQEFDGREDTELLGDDLLSDVPACLYGGFIAGCHGKLAAGNLLCSAGCCG